MISSIFDVFGRMFDAVSNIYQRSLSWSLSRPWSVIVFSVLLVVLTALFIAPRVGLSFMPQTDRNELSVRLEFPAYYNIESTKKRIESIESSVRSLQFVEKTA